MTEEDSWKAIAGATMARDQKLAEEDQRLKQAIEDTLSQIATLRADPKNENFSEVLDFMEKDLQMDLQHGPTPLTPEKREMLEKGIRKGVNKDTEDFYRSTVEDLADALWRNTFM